MVITESANVPDLTNAIWATIHFTTGAPSVDMVIDPSGDVEEASKSLKAFIPSIGDEDGWVNGLVRYATDRPVRYEILPTRNILRFSLIPETLALDDD
jgi:hypothetical protein